MAAVMYGATGDGELVELRETPFEQELHLQNFLTKHPALLAGDQMNSLQPRRFVLVTAEAGIRIAEDGGNYFSLDHLFVDQDGIPTLVEVKRSTDTRLRREVVGQMLEYAANACAYWDASHLRSMFDRRCEKERLSTNEELGKLGVEAIDQDALWEKVGQNLKQERLRLVFLADKFAPETQRIIEFLNRQVQTTEVYAVEVRQYTDAGGRIRTLVPRVLNPSMLQTDRREAMTSGRGELWTEEQFYAALAEKNGAEAVSVFRRIQDWALQQGHVSIFFGRGKTDGSLQVTFKGGNNPDLYQPLEDTVIVSLWSYGRLEIEFQYLMARAPFETVEKRQELWRRLTTGSSLEIDENRIDKRPSVRWSDLTDVNNMRVIIDAIQWVVQELGAASLPVNPSGQQPGGF